MLGRPSKLNADREQIVLTMLQKGHGMGTAARAAGVSKPTLFNWIYAARAGHPGYEDFDRKVDRARDRRDPLRWR